MTPQPLRLAAIAAALLIAPALADARGHDAGPLSVDHAWVKAPPTAAPTAAGYLTVTNHGKTADRLLGGSSPGVQAVQPHSMSMAGGVMRMRALPDGWAIAPGATLTLAPGGDHLMLIGPKRPLRPGDRLPVTLRFARAGDLKVEFVVASEAPADQAHKGEMKGMAGMDMP